MLTFKEHSGVTEAMSMAQRQKAKATFRKNKGKIALGRKKAAKRAATPEQLKSRAIKAARNLLTQKILTGKSKDELSFPAREALEKKLDKMKGKIAAIAKKLLPKIKAADKAKLQKNKDASEGII